MPRVNGNLQSNRFNGLGVENPALQATAAGPQVPEQAQVKAAPVVQEFTTPIAPPVAPQRRQEVKPIETVAPLTQPQVLAKTAPVAPAQVKAAPKVVETQRAIEPVPAQVKTAAPVDEVITSVDQKDPLDLAREALEATDDPTSKARFNQALSRIGLFNQAQKDMLQQQINNDPSLAGQPTGTALLGMLARQQGGDVSNIITNLSLESANRIRELNTWGFERLSAVTKFREGQKADIRRDLLSAGDFDAYASRFKEDTGINIDVSDLKEMSPATQTAILTQQDLLHDALVAGNLQKAEEHFNTIVSLAPNSFKGASFKDMGFEDESFLLGSDQDESISLQIRNDVNQGEFDRAIEGIETRFDLEQRIDGGVELFTNKTVEEINEALSSVGLDPIADKSELIGREDELFTAFKVSDILKESSKTQIDHAVDFFVDNLMKTEGAVMLDDTDMRLIRSMADDMVTGGYFATDGDGNITIDPNELVRPWEEGSPTENEFKSWPIMDLEGKITEESEYYTESNPEALPDSEIGKYEADLDAKWADYKRNTPKDDQVSMNSWFFGTKGGTVDFNETNVPGGLDNGGGGGTTDLELEKFKAELGTLSKIEFDNRLNDPDFYKNVQSALTDFSRDDALNNLTIDNIKSDFVDGPTKGFLKVGGVTMRVDEPSIGDTISGHKTITFRETDDNGVIIPNSGLSLLVSGEHKGKISAGNLRGLKTQTIEEWLVKQKAARGAGNK